MGYTVNFVAVWKFLSMSTVGCTCTAIVCALDHFSTRAKQKKDSRKSHDILFGAIEKKIYRSELLSLVMLTAIASYQDWLSEVILKFI